MEKGYVFNYGVDGFGEDVAPAHEFGVYLDFNKAFQKLVELNHNQIKERKFYEDGYGVDYFPNTDKELTKAEEEEDWDLFEEILNKHTITDEIEINKKFFVNNDPYFNFYSIEEIEIFA